MPSSLHSHPLNLASGETNFTVPGELPRTYNIELQLPNDLTCDQCILQWTYEAGNSWGTDPDGTQCVGCGPQEHFRACADIKISSGKASLTNQTNCTGIPPYDKEPKIGEWCDVNCSHDPPFCPEKICQCQ